MTATESMPMGMDSRTIVSDADGQVYHTYLVFGTDLLELVQYNFMFDFTPEGRPAGAPEMSFLRHKDAYEYPGGIY